MNATFTAAPLDGGRRVYVKLTDGREIELSEIEATAIHVAASSGHEVRVRKGGEIVVVP